MRSVGLVALGWRVPGTRRRGCCARRVNREVEGSMSVDLGDVCVSTYVRLLFRAPALRVFTLAAQVHKLRQNSSTPTTRPISHTTTGASACITPGSAQSAARPRGKIGDRPHGDAHSTQFRNLRFCSPTTSRTQALAPSGPNPPPHNHVPSRRLVLQSAPHHPLCVGRRSHS